MNAAARAAFLTLAYLFALAGAQAQQLYRWTDEKGRVHITDTPPPASAKGVQKKAAAGAGAAAKDPAVQSFELIAAMKDFPVVLYTSPSCKEACDMARAALNKRGVPFKEVQVWDADSNEELKKVSGGDEVPTLTVGRSVQRGFQQDAFDALLDSARYPRAGLLPARSQAAPSPPEGYTAPGAEGPKAEPVKPAAAQEEAPRGPYAPGAPKQRSTQAPQKK